MKKPLVLMILDGWGINKHLEEKNAITAEHPTNFYNYIEKYPNTELEASGEAVGLPDGQMGNSEVGHLNIGAGRVIYQPLVKISKEIREETILENKALKDVMTSVKRLHFTGLLSDGGVHSHIEHLIGLIKMAKTYNVEEVFIHAILDGRDTAPKSALIYIEKLENAMTEIGLGKIASVSGRYFAMDRDKNWDRVEKAYQAIVNGVGSKNFNAKKIVELSYEEDIIDEFVKPSVITDMAGNAIGDVKDGDGFICFNFRPDRAREITRAINDKNFDFFVREANPVVKYVCMTQYDSTIDAPVAYPAESLTNVLGEVLKNNNLKQLRTAETEKYAHVTFFFNGGLEEAFEGEDRELVSSPKVATYDLQPEMSAYELTDSLLAKLDEDKYDVIVVNYANPDMVGHTGNFDAAKKAIKAVDECVGKITDKVLSKDGTLFITADHGNAELMEDPISHVPFTAHTTNKVPFIMISNNVDEIKLKEGKLADIAPTMLSVLNIDVPSEMTGKILIEKK